MRNWHITLTAGVLVTLMADAVPSRAQQVTLATPYHTMADSFFENNRIGFSGNYRGITFSVNNGALTTPQFGSPQTGAGFSTGFAIAGKDGIVNFNASFGQGYRQTFSTQTPSVTIMNGQTGYVSDTSLTPFVISVIPVVGAFPAAPQPMPNMPFNDAGPIDPRVQAMLQAHADAQAKAAAQAAAEAQAGGPIPPLQQPQRPNNLAPQPKLMNVADPVPAPPDAGEAAAERLGTAQKSTAGRPAPSVAEARRLHQQEQAAADGEMAALMERARALEEDGKPNVAKIYYQRVVRQAKGELQQQARTRLYELQDSGKR